MAAVMPQTSSNSPSPRSHPSSQNTPSLPPIVTNSPARLSRASSYAKNRLSTYSTSSNNQNRSRPQSTVFPIFHSSLPYTLVRDFAYGPVHPLFYGPLPEGPSEISTPASEVNRRLSDPPAVYETARAWSATSWEPGERLPQTSFDNGHDGPPWSEDEDIHSPVVTSSRHHKKHKSNLVDFDRTGSLRTYDDRGRRGSYAPADGEGSQMYYLGEVDETAGGPGGAYVEYPPGDRDEPLDSAGIRRDSHFPSRLSRRAYTDGSDDDEDMSDTSDDIHDESRLSRNYQFTITDPAEEMHGKAVALFDFARENDNELPLVEGQVILVSYRHGQGWVVAQDPKTGESGLVPEEYVRLLRDIEGGWNGLMDEQANVPESLTSPVSAGPEAKTPTQAEHRDDGSNNGGAFYTPVVSTFSTSSKDFHPYPQHRLGSQVNTPTATTESHFGKSQDELVDSDTKADHDEEAPAGR